MNYSAAVASYSQVKTHSGVEDASPHQLICMLFDGALERIAQAKGAMDHGNVELKGAKINSAINIVNGLRENLNHDDSEDISANLERLYEYITRILSQAHLKNDKSLLDEAAVLLADISTAWKQIA
ncbi:flagellar export chaperone FliS [Agaribacterium haliotis]|uniref:flagellar export chaperone FliS n=1 Tax=Agaribacterium haliotis TaxID=2013869 RepID=UPI000BB58045|nr:flagellar export chaperone FliS [Agaribacterium haliotis]